MNKILVAYDGSEPAHRALERGAELAEAFGAELGVVSVTPWRAGTVPMDVSADVEAHAKVLKSASDWLSQRGLSATLLSPIGNPGRTIEEVAEDGNFDTIIVGTRGLGAIGRFIEGSVSEHLATNAKATVVIAR